ADLAEARFLVVSVIAARNLPRTDITTGQADPYCKLTLGDEHHDTAAPPEDITTGQADPYCKLTLGDEHHDTA
ncbi:hypothetical protein T484DRAFT_1857269, partial [Baffinella frigidus]